MIPRKVAAGRGLQAIRAPAVMRQRPRNTAAENYFDALNAPVTDTPLLFQLIALVDAWQRFDRFARIDVCWPIRELVEGQTTFLNLKDPDRFPVTVEAGSPIISPLGVQDPGGASVLDTGFTPSLHGANWTDAACEFGCWINTNEMPASYFGMEMGAGDFAFLRVCQTTAASAPTRAGARINRNQTFQSNLITSAVGLTSAERRTAVAGQWLYRGKDALLPSANGGDAMQVPNAALKLLCWTAAGSFSPRRMSFAYAGAPMYDDRAGFVDPLTRWENARGAS